MRIAHHDDPAAFRDLANPTTNRIHRKLNHLPRGQRESYTFA
jgi:hypothetical protein